MAEEYVLIDDIIKNHNERILSLRKYYPFFAITENAFAQFRGGEYKDLDMGYLVLAVLRFFINENSFNDKPVSYKEYEVFTKKLLMRDFGLEEVPEELTRYIFDKIRNSGRAFEMPFYDPQLKESKIARVRLIDSTVKEDEVLYSITKEGIEFYLSTKELKDESVITTDQLLLEKMIRSENFRGSIDVIERINIEVKALEKQRQEVMHLLLSDIHAGTEAVDAYMDRTTVWFAEERKSFAKNRELLDKAAKRLSFSDDSKAAKDVSRLQTMLKQTIENHSALIAATAELSRFSDEMIARSRTRSLKVSFDYQALLGRAVTSDRPDILGMVVGPFLQPRHEKSLAVGIIDSLVLSHSGEGLKGEEKENLKADLNYKYPDEILSENIGMNFAKLFRELLLRLKRWKKVTLEEYLAILEVKFGEDIYKNRDLYAFLIHLAGKTRYSISEMMASQETFLDDMVVSYIGEEALREYADLEFEIRFGTEDIAVGKADTAGDGEYIGKLRDFTVVLC